MPQAVLSTTPSPKLRVTHSNGEARLLHAVRSGHPLATPLSENPDTQDSGKQTQESFLTIFRITPFLYDEPEGALWERNGRGRENSRAARDGLRGTVTSREPTAPRHHGTTAGSRARLGGKGATSWLRGAAHSTPALPPGGRDSRVCVQRGAQALRSAPTCFTNDRARFKSST